MENNQLSGKLLKQIHTGIDIKQLLGSIVSKWYWFAICLFTTLTAGYMYIRYTTPLYSIKSLILIEEKDRSPVSALLSKMNDNRDGGSVNNLFNEMSLLTSMDLVTLVADSLDMNIQYWTQGRVKEDEIFETCPIRIVFDTAGYKGQHIQEIRLRQVVDGLFEIKENTFTDRVMYDSWIERSYGRFKILYNMEPGVNLGYLAEQTEIIVRVEPLKSAVSKALGMLFVQINDGRTSLLDISYKDNLPKRGIKFLNTLLYFYRKKELEDINLSAEKTREFIREKKREFIAELQARDSLEQKIKLENEIIDVKTQSTAILTEQKAEEQKIRLLQEQRQSVYNLKHNILEGVGEREEVLAGLGVADPFLTSLVANYNTLIQQKENLERNTAPLHPSLVKIKNDVAAQRKQIADACDRIISSLDISIRNAARNIAASEEKIQSLPVAERNLNDTKREYPLIQSVYLYIYQRDMENDIAQYAATNKSKIIVAPYSIDAPLKPVKKNIYTMMFMLGVMLPASVIVARILLNKKVVNEGDIESLTTIPIIGTISRANDKTNNKNIVVGPHVRTGIAEQFRLIRANLEFMSAAGSKKIYLITSSMSGEGKTFISLNLGITMTLAKKRVVVMEFDLRKPKLSTYLGLQNDGGISGYLAGMSGIEKVIKASGVHENLYIANCGPIPPNPGELLVLPTTQQLIEELQEMFDVIIMDTAPIGLVSDALILSQYSDINMFIIRQSYTVKDQIRLFDNLYKEKKIRNSAIIFNGVEHLKQYGYGYGYGYGGSYGYGYQYTNEYYADEPQKKKKKRKLVDILFKK